MLKNAAEVRKIINEKEYALNSVTVKKAIDQMIRHCKTCTYCEIESLKLIEELKALGYTVEPEKDPTYPNVWKISI